MYGGGGDCFYKVASGSESTMSVSNTGGYDHIYGVMLAFRGQATSSPINVTALNSSSGTSGSAAAVTTTVADCMVVNVVQWAQDATAGQSSSPANAGLTSVTEQFDGGTTSGNGGGITVITGFKAAAGSTGNTTFTLANSQAWGTTTFAIAPVVYKHTLLLCC